MKNKITLAILILSTIALIFSGCGGGGTTPPINHSPTITSLTANPQSPIEINQSTVITCSASDPDGDPLTYTWSKTGGTITGTGSAITWTAPSTPGTCTITCIVSDGELTDEQSISIDVEQELPPDITEPELIEIASAKIILDEGGIIEVTNPESEFYGLQLIIEPQKNIKEKEKGLPVTVSISIAYVEGCKLPEYQGFLTTPIIVKSTYIDIICKLKIPYHDAQLLNAGVGKNEPVKACRVLSPPLNWGELPPDEYTTSDNMVSISIGLGDIFYFYTLTVENAIPPDSSRFKDPLPGDLVYKFSKFWPLNINEGWLPGHVGIYVGEKYDEENNKKYNVIEALLGGVTRSHYPDISSFGGNSIYLGAREPKGDLSHLQRNKIVAFVEDAVGTPYSFIDTLSTMFFSGLGRGNLVKGYGNDFNCVGLAEAAYESDGVNIDIVSNYDEGNDAYGAYYILTPAEQWFNTVPATGVIDQNIPPEISNLEVIPEGFIEPNSLVFITCNAIDQDQDTLIYIWTTPVFGEYFITSTKGKSISWGTPNEEGNYIITCKVIDNYGGEDEKSINISVGDDNVSGSQYVIQWSNAESNGWANPLGEGEELITSTAYDYNSDIYLNNWGKKHTGTDIIGELDGDVYSIASGTIVEITRDYSSTSNQSVVIIKHTNSNNENFFAIYGHVFARSDLEVNNELEAGEKIGTIKKAGSPVHLHFGINLSSEITDFIFTNSDGQWGWGRIPAFANPSDYGWVDPIDYLNIYQPLSSLTPEEIELIRKWGFGGDDIVRRWPDGYVDVYDETNYTRMQDVLQEWNTAIGGQVIFHLSNDPNSPVKVKFDPDISQDLAGQYLIYCSDDNYEFYRADVNIQKNYLDSLNSDTKYCLYLWLFSGVTGFNIQADVDPNPFKEWWNFDKIPDDIKTMLHGLYKVPCGYNLLDKKLKENWSQSTVRNLQNIYEGKLYEYK